MSKAVLVCYEQIFNGKLLRDSYVRYIDDDYEKFEIMQALYDDPHVTRVWFEEVKEQ